MKITIHARHRRIAAALLCSALAGCADLRPGTIAAETTWQALNVVDTGQTVSIARNPQLWGEGGSGFIIGHHPSIGHVYELMAGYAILHAGVTVILDERDPGSGPWHAASIAWHVVSLGSKAYTVIGRNDIDPWLGRKGPR